ncbi:carbohydrate sulfotransferase 11 [Helicoverpa zea]|uniref:carbohydrate sulfotransferase 11 n=1 Tax=Helicoverpa zea TaxID=7113 RepID=UPI001F5AB5C3|nr:carbohydrate sulfotransferase 11 [Helicoverpa zea]
MLISVKRLRSRIRSRAFVYLRCGAKTAAFLFWATLYMAVMKMTIFKSSVNTPPVKDWSALPDNYSMWLFQSQTKEELETNGDNVWLAPDNATFIELDQRLDKVQEVCRMRNLFTQKINNKEFFVDQKHRLVWCNIFKAASSYWLYYFNILGGYDKKFLQKSKSQPLNLARKKFPRPSEDDLKAALKTPGVLSLLVVREPFVRLLSAYRDKLEIQIKPFYRKLAKSIISKYRQTTIALFGKPKLSGPTFYEFVQYLIDQNKGPGYEFNEHWAPYYQFCSPCAVNFSVIAKVETLDKDSMYVIQQLQLGKVLDVKVGERRRKQRYLMNLSRDGKNTTALLKHYFSQLDEYMLNDLLKIYGVDFEMFGYDADIYKRYVRKPQLKV